MSEISNSAPSLGCAARLDQDWPAGGLESLGYCPICGETRRHVLHTHLRDLLFGAPGEWTLYSCERCRCAYLDPRPTPESLHLAYQRYYTHERQAEDDPLQPVRGRLAALKQLALRAYLRRRFGASEWMLSDSLGWLLWLRPRLPSAIDDVMRHLRVPARGATLLDIGCGNGRFMAWARTAGWQCEGTEVDAAAAQTARSRGFMVHTDDLKSLAASGRCYDAVTLSHVIEHVYDPLDLLRTAWSLLRAGGRVWIETPNIDAHGHRVFGAGWRALEPPRHLQLFTPGALRDLLTRAGFSHIRLAPSQLAWTGVAAASREMTGTPPPAGVLWRWIGERHQRVGRAEPGAREFITLIATREAPG